MSTSKIIVAVLSLLIVLGTIAGLIIADARDTTVLTIGKDKYYLKDYESYGKVWAYENDTTLINDPDSMLSQYKSYKTFYRWADKVGLTLEDSELPASLESGDAEKLLNDYKLTEEEYMRVQTEMNLANKLYQSAYLYGNIPDSAQDEYITYLDLYPEALQQNYSLKLSGGASVKDYLKTVYYRVFEIPLPEEPEESGDVSGESKVDRTQAILDAKLEAQELIAQVKDSLASGDTVEEAFASIAQGDLASVTRYSLGTGYSLAQLSNGASEALSRLNVELSTKGSLAYSFELESKVLIDGIANAILKQKQGEFSDIFETDDSVAFIYIEEIVDGLEGTELESFQNDFSNYYISVNSEGIENKVVARKFKVSELPGVIASMKAAEDVSGDAIPLEIVPEDGSGDASVSIEVAE